jgi:hypothetical protein
MSKKLQKGEKRAKKGKKGCNPVIKVLYLDHFSIKVTLSLPYF